MPRGGKRKGSGRKPIEEEGCSYDQRAISKTVTLPAELWDWLSDLASNGRPSTAIKGLANHVRYPMPNGTPVRGLRYRP